MIPTKNEDLDLVTLVEKEQPTLTYTLNIDDNRLRGLTENQAAMKQAIYLILSTERYQYSMYSWNYGVELQNLIGTPLSYALPEIKRCITEALLYDERITSVDNFDFKTDRNKVLVTFTVNTIYGEIKTETEVKI